MDDRWAATWQREARVVAGEATRDREDLGKSDAFRACRQALYPASFFIDKPNSSEVKLPELHCNRA